MSAVLMETGLGPRHAAAPVRYGRPEDAAVLRRRVRALLRDFLGADVDSSDPASSASPVRIIAENADVIVTELFTNALAARRNKRMRVPVAFTVDQHGLWIQVGDDNPTMPASPATDDILAEAGRGLLITASLADALMVTELPAEGGKMISALLYLPSWVPEASA